MIHRLKFNPKWIDPLLNEEKEATIRYNLEELNNGVYLINSETNECFATAKIAGIEECRLVNAIDTIEHFNLKYPINTTDKLVEDMRGYYTDITMESEVFIVIFDEILDAR